MNQQANPEGYTMDNLFAALNTLGACNEALDWVAKYSSPKEAWEACERGEWLLWLVGRKQIGERLPTPNTSRVNLGCELALPTIVAWEESVSSALTIHHLPRQALTGFKFSSVVGEHLHTLVQAVETARPYDWSSARKDQRKVLLGLRAALAAFRGYPEEVFKYLYDWDVLYMNHDADERRVVSLTLEKRVAEITRKHIPWEHMEYALKEFY